MEPELRFGGIRLRPAVPWIYGLGFTVDKAPVKHGYVMFLGDRKKRGKRAAVRPGHVFRAPKGLAVTLELDYSLLEFLRPVIVMEADDVGMFDLKPLNGLHPVVG